MTIIGARNSIWLEITYGISDKLPENRKKINKKKHRTELSIVKRNETDDQSNKSRFSKISKKKFIDYGKCLKNLARSRKIA